MTVSSGPVQITGYAAHAKGADLVPFTYDAPALGADDVHIEISHCGVCHSDIHTLDEGWGPTAYPCIVGHEIVGTVQAIGEHVTHLAVGDRVGVGAQCGACSRCSTCLHGKDNLCGHGVFTYNATHPSGRVAYGGYAQAVRVPGDYAFKLPADLPSDVAAPLLCAGVTVFAPLKRHMFPGARVGVVGIGGLGHLAVQFAKALGASEVVGLSTSDRKAKDAAALGATKFVVLNSPEAFAANSNTLDIILCTASHHDMPWDAYVNLLDAEGKFIVVGLPEDSIKINLASVIFRQRSIVGSLIGAKNEIVDMLDFAAKHKVRPWIETMPMTEVNTAIARLRKGDVTYRFVLKNE
ncbi:putative mannitol dehydrogenase [Catenaria anguillulae PL171]|uniref:Putative mannitol dehydrogenase n=1 Tax=Catenaria anguillulae PL171 TaxID=765915 RepID=A0A1Y2HNS7_9FUNG|nr:putative mannitol dehydrogenase [Catenaria anguillulae PL171]